MPLRNLHRPVRMMGIVYKLQGTITEILDAQRVKVTWTHIVKDDTILPLGSKSTYQYNINDLELLEWSQALPVPAVV